MDKVYLCDDILYIILNNLNILCHVCNKKYNINFYNKLGPFYYCSEECFNFI